MIIARTIAVLAMALMLAAPVPARAGDIGGPIVGFHILVNEGRATPHILGELKLELLEAVVAKRGAEARDRRLRDTGPVCQFRHGQPDDARSVSGHVVSQAAFGRA